MLKLRNRLLIVLIFALGVSALWSATSDARPMRAGLGDAIGSPVLKPRATQSGAGEPDVGDHKNNPNGEEPRDPNDSVLIGPNGYLWITTIWARRYLGVGW